MPQFYNVDLVEVDIIKVWYEYKTNRNDSIIKWFLCETFNQIKWILCKKILQNTELINKITQYSMGMIGWRNR
jgi:hypothetical protein